MRAAQQNLRPRPVIATEPGKPLPPGRRAGRRSPRAAPLARSLQYVRRQQTRKLMSPAIALRLRQHLTLTPQVQQALKLLQMSALEFAQEMEQALAANPFLEENTEAPEATPLRDAAVDDIVVPQEPTGSGSSLDREQDDWSGAIDTQPTLQQHLKDQLMISPMGDRDRALAQ